MLLTFVLALTLFLISGTDDPGDSVISHETAIHWMTFEDAVARVKSERSAGDESRMLFVEIYASWCPYCKRFDAGTLTDPDVIEMLNTRFYPVRLDGEQESDIEFNGHTFKFIPNGERGYHELAVGLSGGQLSYPTLVFMNEDLQVVQPLPGYRPPEELLPILSFFGEKHYLDTPWETFLKTYEAKAGVAP